MRPEAELVSLDLAWWEKFLFGLFITAAIMAVGWFAIKILFADPTDSYQEWKRECIANGGQLANYEDRIYCLQPPPAYP